MTYLEQSLNLIILQYSDKQNARAEMTALINEYQSAWTFFENFIPSFDIDKAYGDRLDLIGKIVGLSRTVNLLIDKKYFGFEGQTNALGFGQAPFYRASDERYSASELSDNDYQFYLKAKIIKNNVKAIMAGENSIPKMFYFLFKPYTVTVEDNKDMTLTIVVEGILHGPGGELIETDPILERLSIMQQLDLMPLPQGVRIKEIKCRWCFL